MKNYFKNFWNRARDWTLHWAHSPHMAAALLFVAFIEAINFPIPPDVLLRGALLLAMADEKSEDIVVQLARELAIEIAEPQILLIFVDGLLE